MADDPNHAGMALLREEYRAGKRTPRQVVEEALERIRQTADPAVFIHLIEPRATLAAADALAARDLDQLPLYGVPFTIKDNIDLAGAPTTAACPAFSYTPAVSAPVVARMLAAGAIPLGKVNLDQFAAGLVGVRSPYGVPRNPFDPAYVPGGSSSGSAVSVARGFAGFSLGTDTAGSGRVPAAFNNLVGLKPTKGLLSTRGVVPACRSLDCVSLFTLTCADAAAVFGTAAAFDPDDPYSRRPPADAPSPLGERFRVGIPLEPQLEYFGNPDGPRLFHEALDRLRSLGGEVVRVDFEPFLTTARLLYEGPWVAERYAAIEDLLKANPDAFHPVTREILEAGSSPSAVAAFRGQYRLAGLRRRTDALFEEGVDLFCTPTAGTIYRVDEVGRDPVRLNSNLGRYTNFMNLLDLCALALPAGFQANGLPFGITLFGQAYTDGRLLGLGSRYEALLGGFLGATGAPRPVGGEILPDAGEFLPLAVCGAHLSGMPLNRELTELGARLLRSSKTSSKYRFHALPDGRRPGLVRAPAGRPGAAIEVEVWGLRPAQFGRFVARIPSPLGVGKIELEDGTWVTGFLCESAGVEDAPDISEFGGWRSYVAAKTTRFS